MAKLQTEQSLKTKYESFRMLLNERQLRLALASEALSMGRGGISMVSRLSGASRSTITTGIRELKQINASESLSFTGIRKPGGGRIKETQKNKDLEVIIEQTVCPHTLGDPMSPLLWSSKSLRKIATAIKEKGCTISHQLVGTILKEKGYSLRVNKKTDEGADHIDRDAQFHHINDTAKDFLASGDPVLSVDCKKKELIGNYKNAGAEWLPQGQDVEVRVHDFEDKELGKAIPYGIYDIGNNEGWVNVGISAETAGFAVASIRSWWEEAGKEKFKHAKRIYITADGGGSNSSRSRLWKAELQGLANETGKEIRVSHFPPGTSKWNKIEHSLFSFITMNWRARPLTSLQVIIELIAATKTEATNTSKGLIVQARLDKTQYTKGIKISDEEFAKINMEKNHFHGEWNYTIRPNIE